MTITPKKKTSKTRTRQRTTNWIKLKAKKLLNRVQLQLNEAWVAVGLAHFAKIDGTYKGRQVYKVKSKKKSVTRV